MRGTSFAKVKPIVFRNVKETQERIRNVHAVKISDIVEIFDAELIYCVTYGRLIGTLDLLDVIRGANLKLDFGDRVTRIRIVPVNKVRSQSVWTSK